MKKLLAILLAVCLLSGCSLALEAMDGDGIVAEHELTGMFLTLTVDNGDGTITDVWDSEKAGMEPLHVFAMEGKKLYAERVEEDGRVRYEFPEGLGLSCFAYYVFSDVEGETYRDAAADPELKDCHRATHVSNGTTNTLEATIYATEDTNVALHMNPVYQTPEGEVYALGTAPGGWDAASMHGCSETLTQETRIKMGDETVNGGTVKLSIERVVLPEKYIIIEMSGENTVLKTTEYAPDAMPESYIPGPETAYILLEAAGEETVRTVYSPADESVVMDTFYPGQYGLCIKGYTRIEWEGEA